MTAGETSARGESTSLPGSALSPQSGPGMEHQSDSVDLVKSLATEAPSLLGICKILRRNEFTRPTYGKLLKA